MVAFELFRRLSHQSRSFFRHSLISPLRSRRLNLQLLSASLMAQRLWLPSSQWLRRVMLNIQQSATQFKTLTTSYILVMFPRLLLRLCRYQAPTRRSPTIATLVAFSYNLTFVFSAPFEFSCVTQSTLSGSTTKCQSDENYGFFRLAHCFTSSHPCLWQVSIRVHKAKTPVACLYLRVHPPTANGLTTLEPSGTIYCEVWGFWVILVFVRKTL